MSYDVLPGVPVINYDSPPDHRCPLCFHKCNVHLQRDAKERRAVGENNHQIGRRARARQHMLDILQQYASRKRPMPIDALAARLQINPKSLISAIWRARKAGHDIRHEAGKGYWLQPSEPLPLKKIAQARAY